MDCRPATLVVPSNVTLSDAKFSISNWSVNNFLSTARHRISSMASSLATSSSGDTQSIASSIRRRGSWSPTDQASSYHYRSVPKQQHVKRGSFIYSIENNVSRSTSLSSRQHFNRQSSNSLCTLRTAELPTISHINLGNGVKCKAKPSSKYETTSFQISAVKSGSLESVDFDEDDSESSTSSSSSDLENRFPITISSSIDCSPLEEECPYFSSSPDINCLDEKFVHDFGYHSLDEIELYNQLHKILELQQKSISLNENDQATGKRGCSKNVSRFGLGYEDHCKFPLVLPVFINECLQKRSSFITWEYIKLQADAELCRWEYSTLQNLRNRFHDVPIIGTPIDNVCPDSNLFLRTLCYQLVLEGNFRTIANHEKNRALKRWNSIDDIYTLNSKHKIEPEFIGAKVCGESLSKKESFNNESLVLGMKCLKRSKKMEVSKNRRKQQQFSNNFLFNELSILVEQSKPVQLSMYLTRYYLDQFQAGFDIYMLAQLVLIKDIASLNRLKTNQNLRQTLLNLLTFDDIVVTVIGAHFRNQRTPKQQAGALASMIETACLLRQLRNFYGLNVIVGAMQSLPLYSMKQAWQYLAIHMPVHFRDLKRLYRLCRRLENSILGTNKPHIPSLSNVINRLRLGCVISWDLYEANRRFVEHPSIAEWLQTEVIDVNIKKREKAKQMDNVYKRTFVNQSLFARLTYDPLAESYLTNSDPIQLINYQEFPSNWRGRYVPAIPERYLQKLLQSGSFTNMVEYFFYKPIEEYQLADF